MEGVFRSFCSFGSEKSPAKQAFVMDGSKFAKLSKDLHLVDKHLTPTEVDIIFTKVKPKSERKISFSQFEEALKLMAAKKYPGDEGGVEKLREVVLQGKGPCVHGATKVLKSAAVERLTDSSKFTGTHKERFDEEGKGKGIAGRRDVPDGSGYVTGFKEKGGGWMGIGNTSKKGEHK